jgi:hypothetical protein
VNWRAKAAAQGVFSYAPYGDRLNYLFQRRVTKTLPPPDRVFSEAATTARDHLGAFERRGGRAVVDATFFEFGAGWNLAVPMALAALGVEHQVVIDVRELTKLDLLQHTVTRLQTLAPSLGLQSPPAPFSPAIGEGDGGARAVLGMYGIDYRAPSDVRATDLKSRSIDCITSTSTFEHLRAGDVLAILGECHRVLRDDGVMSVWIDYKDHYSYFDANIGPFNFLRYSNRIWTLWSPSLHHQNRLRHCDFVRLFGEAGFTIVEEERVEGTEADLEEVVRLRPAERFRSYQPRELVVRDGRFVARRTG